MLLGLPGSAWAAVASGAAAPATTGKTSQRAPAKLGGQTRAGAQPGTMSRAPERAEAQKSSPKGFSEEQRKRFSEQDEKDKKSDNYKGGVTLVIGGGVLVVALLIVLIIVLVD